MTKYNTNVIMLALIVGIINNQYGIRQLVLIIQSVPMQCNAFTCAVQHAYIILNNAVARCGCICILLRRKQYDYIISQLVGINE